MAHKSLIYYVLFFGLFGGGLLNIGVPSYFSLTIEISIILLFLFSLFARSGKGIPVPHLWHIFLLFLFITLFSIYINDYLGTRSIFSLKNLFRFYFFYLAIIMMQPDDNLIKKINLFIVFLLVLQFPIVAYKFPIYGINEKTAGAYAVHDGSIAATLPICFIFYLASYYFIYKPKLSYILVGLGYIILSIVGAKRIVFFLYPVQFLAIYYYIYLKSKGRSVTKKFMALFAIIPSIILLSGSIIYFNKSLNPDLEVGGRLDLRYTLEYAKNYNLGVDGYGYSYGRVATTLRVIEILTEAGVPQVFFGLGPGITTPSPLDSKRERQNFEKKYDEFKISYGRTTMNRIGLEYGLAGVFLYSIMIASLTRMCLNLYQKETDSYWKAFALGSVCFSFSMAFFAFAYHWTAFWGDTMPVLYFYAMAVVYIRYHHRNLSKQGSRAASSAQQDRQHMVV